MDARQALTFADVLREHRRSRPEQLATGDADFGRDVRLTFSELDDRVSRLARALQAAGVEAGDRVLWLGQNSFRVLEALVAAARLGAMFCPANWRQSADEVAFVIDDLRPRLVVWQETEIGDAVRAGRALASAADAATWIRHDDDEYERFLAGAPADDLELPVDPSSSLLVIYTAAFAGRPNGAMLDHTALITQGLVMASLAGIGTDYRYLNSGPLFHLGTLMTTLATFVTGGANIFTRRVEAEELCRVIEAERCTGAFLVGPIFEQILEANSDHRYDLRSLRTSRARPEWNEMVSQIGRAHV